jgi:hypothetical protein
MAWCHGQQARAGGKALGGRIDPDGPSMVIQLISHANHVLCIGHAWRFDIKTGECYSVPGVSVRTYEVLVEGDEVKIRDDAVPGEAPRHL